jgi:hypothetical protein
MIKTQLQHLLFLQEIDALIDDLEQADGRAREKALGFSIGPTTGLLGERAKIAQSLSLGLLQTYDQAHRRHRRALAPERRGVCLGCYTKRPTAAAARRGLVETCERCGRILFRPEEPKRPPSPEAAPAPARKGRRQSPSS